MRSSGPAIGLVAVVVLSAPAWAETLPPSPSPSPLSDADLLALASETIVVEGEAPRSSTASTREIDQRTVAATPRRSADDLLRLVPGLYLNQHGAEGKAQQFFLRGFDAVHGSDLAVSVGGIPINEPSNVHGHGYVDLGFVIPEAVSLLRAHKGSFELTQGDFATAGSVDLELGAPERGARVGYEVGTTNRHRVVGVIAPEDAPEGTVMAVEAMRDAGFGENRRSERVSGLAQTEVRAGGWTIAPVLAAYAARFGEPGVVPIGDVDGGRLGWLDTYARDGEGVSRRLIAGVRGRRGAVDTAAWVGWRHLSLDENFTGFLDDAEHGDRRLQVHDAVSGGGRAAARWPLFGGIAADIGVEGRIDGIRQREQGLTGDGLPWQDRRSLSGTIASTGVWAGAAWTTDAWRVAGGVRGDGFAMNADDCLDDARDGGDLVGAVSPRLTASWQRGGLALFAAYGRGLRSPEVRAVGAPPPPDNEEVTHYQGGERRVTVSDAAELGTRWRIVAGLELAASGFATRITREAVFDHVSGVNATLDESRRLGVELGASWAPRPGVVLRGDATLVDTRFAVTGNPVPGAPRVMASIEARLWRGAWTAGVVARHLGARPLAHGATGTPSTTVDALASWRRRGWEMSLQIDNALGAEWREGEYHFASWWDTSQPRSSLPRLHYAAGRPLGGRLALTRWW